MADTTTPIDSTNLLPQLASALEEVTTPTEEATDEAEPKTNGFCGTEERISEDSCNSLFPAVSFDPAGTAGVVWTDTRDGNFEIYMKAVKSHVPQELVTADNNTVIDPDSGRPVNLACSGFSSIMALEDIVSATKPSTDTVIARLSGGRLDVNTISRTMTLTGGEDTDFQSLGVLANSGIRILNGLNSGRDFFVSRVLAPNVLDLVFYDGPQNDTQFVYDITNIPSAELTTGDVRLTCNRSTSTYPDIVADKDGRFHIVYQDNATGNYELHYIQVYPACVGQKECSGPIDVFGQITVATEDALPAGGIKDPKKDPMDGLPFFYGNISLPDGTTFATSNPLLRNGLHKIIKQAGSTQWIGLSKASDKIAWDAQMAEMALTDVPSYVADEGLPLASADDFGEQYSFRDVAVLGQTPRSLKVEITRISLPIKPRCAPTTAASVAIERSQDIVSAPKREVPASFVEPTGLSQILSSPSVMTDDSMPARFTIDGDPSGTVFTNVVITNPAGQSDRIVFTKDSGCKEDDIKFIMGQRRCGTELCAVKSSTDLNSAPLSANYQMTLQVWLGPSYLEDETQISNVEMLGNKLFEQTFSFDPGSDISVYQIPVGKLVAPAGRYLFFVLKPDLRLGAYYEGVGGGHGTWYTDGDGTFTQYYKPWTLRPNAGMTLPVYFEGILHTDETLGGDGTNGNDNGDVGEAFFKKIEMPFKSMVGIDYYPTSGTLLAAVNGGTGVPNNLDLIAATGTATSYSVVSNITDDLHVFCVRSSQNGFVSGDSYFGSGQPGSIVKLPSGGGAATNPWLVLPGEQGAIRVSIDKTGIYSGDLLVVTTTGGVWRVDANANPSKLANIGLPLDTVISLPNIPSKYGPWAGKIVVGGPDQSKFWAIDAQGNTETFDLGILPKNMSIVLENQNFYVIEELALYGAAALNFADKIGDVIVTQEDPGTVWHIKWTGAEFKTAKLAQFGELGRACFAPAGLLVIGATDGQTTGGTGTVIPCDDPRLIAVAPIMLTQSLGDSTHPRMAIDRLDNIWTVFTSDRTGSDEVYIAKYYGVCGKWNTSNLGGAETRLTYAANNGKVARSPGVAVDGGGEVHVVYSSDDTEDGKFEIFYMRSMGGGSAFTAPVRLTASSGEAFMPEVEVSFEDGMEKINVVWHDNRFVGQFEVMYASKTDGQWQSSAQGGSDLRITSAVGDSLFPRIASDSKGNLRVVYHDYRKGSDKGNVFMSTYVALAKRWESSGQGGTDIILSATGTGNALHPDVDIDRTNGVFTVWQDDRKVGTETEHQKIYGTYCLKTDSSDECFPAIDPTLVSDYTKFGLDVAMVDCVDFEEILVTNVPEVCLKIRAPGATFFRIANEDGQFGKWEAFKPKFDFETMIVPWVLSCGNGNKQVCVQVQDAQFVSFPVCHNVILNAPLPVFKIEFYKDEEMKVPLATFHGKPVAPEGDVFIKITSCAPLVRPPTFDVISRGTHIVMNQSTSQIEVPDEDASAGAGSFIGSNEAGTFTAFTGNTYKARFHVNRDDGLFHKDGYARVVVHGTDARGNSF